MRTLPRWSPYLAVVVSFLLGLWQKWPCHLAGWPWKRELLFGLRCHSDIPILYRDRGLAAGHFPYATEESLEYPVLTGYLMDAVARLVSSPEGFFLLTALALLGCAMVTVWASIALTQRTDIGLLVAAAPVLALTGTINWDLLAVALTSLALLAWARQRPVLAGIAIGLGVAAKLYPALLLFGIVLLAARSRRWRPAVLAAGAAGASWLLVNAPVALIYPEGWATFWRFNAERGAEFGSAFYALDLLGVPAEPLNPVAMALLVACLAGIGAYAWWDLAPPRLELLALLTVAAFLVTNKVYSPQYVLWLLPLAVVAGARLRHLLLWQVAEVAYWLAIWGFLAGSTSTEIYALATFVRIAATAWMALATTATHRPSYRMGSLCQVTPSSEIATQPPRNRLYATYPVAVAANPPTNGSAGPASLNVAP